MLLCGIVGVLWTRGHPTSAALLLGPLGMNVVTDRRRSLGPEEKRCLICTNTTTQRVHRVTICNVTVRVLGGSKEYRCAFEQQSPRKGGRLEMSTPDWIVVELFCTHRAASDRLVGLHLYVDSREKHDVSAGQAPDQRGRRGYGVFSTSQPRASVFDPTGALSAFGGYCPSGAIQGRRPAIMCLPEPQAGCAPSTA